MLKKLIGSRTRINILKLFVLNPKQDYYVREIARLTKEPFDPARRELMQLEAVGLLKSRVSGRQKYYSVNTNHALFPEFKSMILKTVGIGDAIRSKISKRDDIIVAFVYGSYAKNIEDIDSDIDLFVVGDISLIGLQEIISGIEAETKREINPTVYSVKELKARYKTKNNFIMEVFKSPKIFLNGDENGFRKLVSEQGKLLKHKATEEELAAIFGVIDRNFKDTVIKGLSSDQKYILSYQAAFEVALALIKCQGYRPVKAGHHYIVWQCLKELLNEDKIKKQILLFENAAKKRSKLSYDIAGLASQKEADEMCREAQDFVRRIKQEINKFSIK